MGEGRISSLLISFWPISLWHHCRKGPWLRSGATGIRSKRADSRKVKSKSQEELEIVSVRDRLLSLAYRGNTAIPFAYERADHWPGLRFDFYCEKSRPVVDPNGGMKESSHLLSS